MQRRVPHTPKSSRHGGAVIIVVLSLLGALLFLGIFFFSWTSQEATNARNFEEQASQAIDPDDVDNFLLRQVLVGTPQQYTQSPLYGGQNSSSGTPVPVAGPYSILAAVIGRINPNGSPTDVKPHSGRGIQVIATADNNMDGLPDANTSTQLGFDYNGDLSFDADGTDLAADPTNGVLGGFILNYSSAANFINPTAPFDFGGSDAFGSNSRFVYQPDVDYTYPDVNNLFLAYDAIIPFDPDGDGVDPGEGLHVVIPSYFRPQLYPDRRTSLYNPATFSGGFSDIYTRIASAAQPLGPAQVLRPHAFHRNVDGSLRYVVSEDLNGNGVFDTPQEDLNLNGIFDTLGVPARSGDPNRIIAPFPFRVDQNQNLVPNEMGVFSLVDNNGDGTPDGVRSAYDYDVDADGDGTPDSIWLDLDYPIINLPDGRQAVPMFYVKIIDADALLNVNEHGQAPLLTAFSNVGSGDVGAHIYNLASGGIHASNTGASVAEVNPLPALYAEADPASPILAQFNDPTALSAATLPERGFVANRSTSPPTDRTNDGMGVEGFNRRTIANVDLARILYGSPEFQGFTPPNDPRALNFANPNPVSDIPGRYGENLLVRSALTGGGIFASAGDTTVDDDGDDNNPANNGPLAPGNDYPSGIAHQDNFGGLLPMPLTYPPAVHPRDMSGMGNFNGIPLGLPFGRSYLDTNFGGVRSLAGSSLPLHSSSPSRWLYYGAFNLGVGSLVPAVWQNQDNGVGIPIDGVLPWSRGGNPVGGDLQNPLAFGPPPYDGLWNEPDELTYDANFPTAVDAPYPPSELAFLHLSNADWNSIREDSRLRKLVYYNFVANRQATAIRQQFTTDSRDRLEHSATPQFTEDVNFNGMLDMGEDLNGDSMPNIAPRAWEFNDIVTGNRRFPPKFGTTGGVFGNGFTSRHEGTPPLNGPPLIDPNDPFRPVVRRLLATEEGNTANIGANRYLPGQRLDLSRLLINFDQNGNPIYRRLTPHPIFDGTESDTNMYLVDASGNPRPTQHTNSNYAQAYFNSALPPLAPNIYDPDIIDPTGTFPTPIPFSDITNANPNIGKFAQEAWARHDRQRLARDIYVLLYTLCAGNDGFDPTTTPYPVNIDANSNGIDDITVERMAQFAVNYVDALDPDNVITRFEYDANLSDGWNVVSGSSPVAYGVEAQQLAFSEAMLLRAPTQNTDQNRTLYNESPNTTYQEHQFLYIELRNASPFTVPFLNQSWRIVRTAPGTPNVIDAAVEFRAKALGDYKLVGPGENFLISCSDGTLASMITSDFFADITGGAELECVIPENTTFTIPNNTPSPPPNPQSDLDLAVLGLAAPGDHENYRTFTKMYNGTGTLVEAVLAAGTPVVNFDLVLQRRRNLYGAGFGEYTIPGTPSPAPMEDWIEVDRININQAAQFNLTTDTQATVQTEMAKIRSTERYQTFDGATIDCQRPGNVHHTISAELMPIPPALNKHQGNYSWETVSGSATSPFTLWQPHFDRDFSSAYELLTVPVRTPADVVRGIRDAKYPSANAKLTGWSDSTAMPNIPYTAQGLFAHPDGQTPGIPADDNRWYRLFEFIQYPHRSHDTIRNLQTWQRRTEGLINLNTLRHEAVLAGLIDDDVLIDIFAQRPCQGGTLPIPKDAGRNWFDQFLISRDGYDAISGAAGLTMPGGAAPGLAIPGVPGSMPFRGMSYVDPQSALGPTSPEPLIQNTILRNHLTTPNFPQFEARTLSDIGADNVDFHTRNRLLDKIANNTTNRSHVFAIWLGYELFEAHQPNAANPDVVQIGARIEDIPGHREFVVVDMTRLEEAYNPANGTFDFRKFIIYRKRIK